MTDKPPVTASISLTQKVNLGNYESADIFMSLSGVAADTTEAEIEAALETTKIAYTKIRDRLRDKVAEARATKGWNR